MSHHSISAIPDEKDLSGYFGVDGTIGSSGIPALRVTTNITIQFQAEDHEFAVRYLTKLADEARKLAQQIAEAQT